MNNIESIENRNVIEERKNSHLSIDKIYKQDEISLNENDSDRKEENLKTNKKFKINFENIQRKNKNLENNLKQSIESSSKSQVIVISRKRKREEDPQLQNLKGKQSEIESTILSINPNKKFKIEKIDKNDISYKLDKLKIYEPATEMSIGKKSDIKIPNRKLKSFNQCRTCSSDVSKRNLYNNYFPVDVPTDYSSKTKQAHFDSKLDDIRNQLSERRHLKFMEKRKISSKQTFSNEFRDVKGNCNKFFENYRIIDDNDDEKLIIINRNPIDKKDIKAFLESNMEMMPELKIFECSNNMTESDILNIIAKEDVVLDGELQSDSDLNDELDYDSNREDNSDNDYPDEVDDENDSDQHYYQDYDHQDYGSDNY